MFIPETEIIITTGGEELARVKVKPGDYVIGSAETADIVVQAEDVAERHALLTVNYHELFIEDLSSGSTSVAGSAVTGCTRVWPNQKVQIGSAVLETHRIKEPSDTDLSLAPETQVLRELLPAEFLRDKKYDIGGMVAQGGMGDIVDAFEATTGRTVAMKVMLSSLSEEEILRFIGEAQITSQLEHPNIIPVHELGVDEEDHVFYTMKLVQGATLKSILKKLAAGDAKTVASFPLPVLLTVFQKICDGVAFAHSRSVVHRDLRPANVTVGEYGEVLVMAWGAARCFGSAQAEDASGEAERFDPQVDISALGAILYQILSLRPPETDGPIEPLIPAHSAVRRSLSGSRAAAASRPHLPDGRIPESLAAVAMKALSADSANRYATVPELQAEITAYQDGFATSAEHASLLKQLVLLVGRHKQEAMALAASIAVLFALGLGAYAYTAWERNVALRERQRADDQRIEADGQRIQAATERTRAESERERAERTLSDLRTAAPAYHRQAAALIQAQKFGEAIESIGFAIALAPDNPDFHLFRANTLQAMQRLPEAADSYNHALALRPEDASAKVNLELCHRLLATAAGNPLTRSQQTQLLDAIVAQKRSADGVFLASALGREAEARLAKIKAQLGDVTQQPKWNDARLASRDDGTVAADLSDLSLPDLSVLRDLPISALIIARVGVSDLSPLAALPLVKLDCSDNPISDLDPLRSRSLKQLSIDSTRVADLSPLKGMALEELSLRHTAVTDLSALRGMPLQTLSLAGLPIASIDVLGGMPLRRLDLFGCHQLSDLSPLTTLGRLETLNLPAHFTDLALIQKLRSIKRLGSGDFGAGVAAFDKVPPVAAFLAAYTQRLTLQTKLAPRLEQLRQTLRQLGAPESSVATVALTGDGFIDLDLTALPIENLSVLSGLPVRRLIIKFTKISDLTPLRSMPLTALDASNTVLKDLAPLAACLSLTALDISQTRVVDLRPLAGLKLERLALSHTAVQDLSPLQRMPLRSLFFDGTKVEDLNPAATCAALENITISRTARDLGLLRRLPALLRISGTRDFRSGQPSQSAAEFWAEYDATGKTREADAKLQSILAKFQTLSGWGDERCQRQPDGTYKLDLSALKIEDLTPLRDLPISILNISATGVTRLGPIVNCPIRELHAKDCLISDLPLLGRLPIERLTLTHDGPGEFRHLRGLRLRSLTVHAYSSTPLIADLGPLKNMPLEQFGAHGFFDVANLDALGGAPISDLRIPGAAIKDIGPLRRMPLTVLSLGATRVSDVSVLRGLPLVRVDLVRTNVRDVSPLADCKALETIVLPRGAKGIETLRNLPKLKRIAFEWTTDDNHAPALTAEEFWAEFDKQKKL